MGQRRRSLAGQHTHPLQRCFLDRSYVSPALPAIDRQEHLVRGHRRVVDALHAFVGIASLHHDDGRRRRQAPNDTLYVGDTCECDGGVSRGRGSHRCGQGGVGVDRRTVVVVRNVDLRTRRGLRWETGSRRAHGKAARTKCACPPVHLGARGPSPHLQTSRPHNAPDKCVCFAESWIPEARDGGQGGG